MASSFASGNLAQLFATPLWTFQPVRAKELIAQLVPWLRAQRAQHSPLSDGIAPALRGGASAMWQSRDDLHERAELAELVALVYEAAAAARSLLQVQCE